MHPEATPFVAPAAIDRRKFIVTALASGFALAVQPVAAQSVITTSADGLIAGEVQIPVKDGMMPAYRAAPEGKKNLPTILVVQEIFGVHEHIKDICRRFAHLGYLAIAPELYARQGDASKYSDIQQLISEVVAKVPDEQVMSDLDATAQWASSNGGDPAKLAVTGFCWGGRIVWLYSAHNPAIKAGIAWYGGLIRPSTPLTPKHPIDLVDDLKGPVLGLYGAADNGIPVDTVEKVQAALKASKNASANHSEIVLYPDTPHGFHADYRPSYTEKSAKDGWMRLQAWLVKNGVH